MSESIVEARTSSPPLSESGRDASLRRNHDRESTTTPPERKAARAPLHVDVEVEAESGFYVGFSGNISEGGLFVATHHPQPIGREVELTLMLPQQTMPLHLTGTVRWVREFRDTNDVAPGMGVRFENVSAADLRIIQEFVAARAPFFFDDETA